MLDTSGIDRTTVGLLGAPALAGVFVGEFKSENRSPVSAPNVRLRQFGTSIKDTLPAAFLSSINHHRRSRSPARHDTMTAIGSVFLGDVQRQRILASSSPPSSPPPHISSSATTHSFSDVDLDLDDDPKPKVSPPTIPPVLSLDLRVRWLETLLYGARPDLNERKSAAKGQQLKDGETLTRSAEDLQRRLDAVVQTNDGLKRFMDRYDQYAHLLTPSFALSGTLPSLPTYENMTPSELEAFLTEMEPDIRAADRDLREIKIMESKG
ncbi:hypothetical protein A0H81_13149 [Grifola frondosa]|uniref:Uncharacterized protein n=1 Tax=Grifola frondosa TaxID=5627 RepID=A0A1C7LQ96_GRIFR|nr:hypothetical protein A0H81_13149 [Grifola frondosa]